MKKKICLLTFVSALVLFFSGCTATFSKSGSRAERGLLYGGPREDQTVVAFDTQFRPGWEKVYAYAYSNGGEKSNGNWPGAELVSYGKGVYFYILPSGLEDSMIIFNNGKGEQLPDVPILPEAHMIMNEEGQWAPWVH